jgi:hypothetical protein
MEETLSILTQSKNEYSSLLTTKITPYIIEGIYSIFNEANSLCEENNEQLKYLMTFQQFLSRITRWNEEIIDNETKRIIKNSNCPYLEDLLTCVHIAQTKILTSVRVGTKQKKIETKIPSLNDFVHRVYIETARNIYKNVYLFEKDVNSLQKQKYRREIELIVQYSILNVIRNTLPVEEIIRAYLDDSVEYDNVEVIEENIEEPILKDIEEIKEIQKQQLREAVEEIKENNDKINSIKQENNTSINTDDVDDVLQQKSELLDTLREKTSNIKQIGMNDLREQHTTHTNNTETKENKTTNEVNGLNGLNQANISLKFNDTDNVKEYDSRDRSFQVNNTPIIHKEAPKDIDTLEKISFENNERRKLEEMEDDDEDLLKIGDDITLDTLDLGIEAL